MKLRSIAHLCKDWFFRFESSSTRPCIILETVTEIKRISCLLSNQLKISGSIRPWCLSKKKVTDWSIFLRKQIEEKVSLLTRTFVCSEQNYGHILIPGILPLHSKKNFADVVKVKDLKIGIILPGLSRQIYLIPSALKSRQLFPARIKQIQQRIGSQKRYLHTGSQADGKSENFTHCYWLLEETIFKEFRPSGLQPQEVDSAIIYTCDNCNNVCSYRLPLLFPSFLTLAVHIKVNIQIISVRTIH